ncbi:hypothetical protein CIB95_11400 [Lottiidibacillus patelloidae]|uniref:Uncharacterized protein n=1 Tax=Lottiidibacillus patelloidae TaxID=2670334 RepID=A0A263BRQ1_9BACI|nr:hypothetical protein [Lottiidibacillus patelloidae]OZM56374.1 hypothetical protein CIB95_11400 [Lottiidibacillus patelloidae]
MFHIRIINLYFAIALITISLVACTEGEKIPFITLQEAKMNHDVPMNQMIETIELDDFVVTFYETEEGFGVIEFVKRENGWGFSGSSLQRYNTELPLTDSGLTAGVDNQLAVYYGQINDEKIQKVIAIKGGKEFIPMVIQGTYGSYWLYTSNEELAIDKEHDQLIGLDKDGNVIYEK